MGVPPERLVHSINQCNINGTLTCNRSMRGNHLAYTATQGKRPLSVAYAATQCYIFFSFLDITIITLLTITTTASSMVQLFSLSSSRGEWRWHWHRGTSGRPYEWGPLMPHLPPQHKEAGPGKAVSCLICLHIINKQYQVRLSSASSV